MNGKIFIISGPAGVGKDTIIWGILKNHPGFMMVKSYTTRPPRESDEAGNRVFVSEKEFKKMIKAGQMIEWAKVHAWYYGRRKNDIVRHIQKGSNVIFDVDVQGAMTYKQKFSAAVLIFLKYKNPEQFEKRILTARPEISQEELAIRKKSFRKEMTYEKYYDYSLINPEGHPQKAIREVEKIITRTLTNHPRI